MDPLHSWTFVIGMVLLAVAGVLLLVGLLDQRER